ncbi:hypothetical protein [Vaginisenegalia massiliensis]|uniref:hypothetical protein n=1 Tax=Vaginisenegalia massiliensis TaxID=2058294 RepID=UPI000F54C07D|nr:hypothetical protein [Vaginisenegalia massiliensis]
MRMIIKAFQPFQVRIQSDLAPLQVQSLLQLYQPLVGPQAVSLYMSLLNLPKENSQWSQRQIHAQLIQMLNMGIQECDQARRSLEAVGLLKTYRDLTSHVDWTNQSLVYDVMLPLDIHQFLEHPLLSTALFNQIGDQAYYQLLKYWTLEEFDLEHYSEITASFEEVFHTTNLDNYGPISESLTNQAFRHQSAQVNQMLSEDSFNYSRFLRYLMAEGIEQSQLTQALKEEVYACHQVFDLDEVQMTQLVRLALNSSTNQIELDQLKLIAQKRHYFAQQRSDKFVAERPEAEKELQATYPRTYNPSDRQQRQQALKENYPDLSAEEIDLILACEQLNCQDFLVNLKAAKGGFATDSEIYYLNDLQANKSTLPIPVLNFLIYTLLVVEKKEVLYKSNLERLASIWQEQAIQSVAQALQYVKAQDKVKQMQEKQQKQSSQRPSWTNYSRPKHEEAIPSWMKQDTANELPANPQSDASGKPINSEELIKRLNKLSGKE